MFLHNIAYGTENCHRILAIRNVNVDCAHKKLPFDERDVASTFTHYLFNLLVVEQTTLVKR